MKKQRQELSIHDLVAIFLPKLWIIVVVSIVFALATMLHSIFLKPQTYTASTEMYVYKNEQAVTGADIAVAQAMLPNYQRGLFSSEFLNIISLKLLEESPEHNVSASSLRSMMKFYSPAETKYFVISVTTTSPELSYKIAQLIEENAPEFIRDRQRDALLLTPGDSPKYTETPNSKNTLGNSLVAFFIGAILSIVCIWLASVFDFVVRDKKKLENHFEIPVLGVIPRQMLQNKPEAAVGGKSNES